MFFFSDPECLFVFKVWEVLNAINIIFKGRHGTFLIRCLIFYNVCVFNYGGIIKFSEVSKECFVS